MTLEHRHVAKPGDINAVTFACQQCHASLSLPITTNVKLPDVCPHCDESWFLRGSNDREILQSLFHGLAGLQDRGADALCQISFELIP